MTHCYITIYIITIKPLFIYIYIYIKIFYEAVIFILYIYDDYVTIYI